MKSKLFTLWSSKKCLLFAIWILMFPCRETSYTHSIVYMCVKYSHRLGITTAYDLRLELLMNSISWATRERRNSIEFQSRHIKLSKRWNSRNQCNKWLFQIFISVISAKSHLWKAIKIKVFTAHKLECLLCWSISSRHIAKKKEMKSRRSFLSFSHPSSRHNSQFLNHRRKNHTILIQIKSDFEAVREIGTHKKMTMTEMLKVWQFHFNGFYLEEGLRTDLMCAWVVSHRHWSRAISIL